MLFRSAPSPCDKMRKHGMTTPERRHQRTTDLRFDLRWLEPIVGTHADRATDIVDENVDASEMAGRFGQGACGTLVGLKVAYEATPPVITRFRCDVTYEVRSIDEQDVSALGSCSQRDRASDTLSGTSHNQRLSDESVGVDHASTASVAENFS